MECTWSYGLHIRSSIVHSAPQWSGCIIKTRINHHGDSLDTWFIFFRLHIGISMPCVLECHHACLMLVLHLKNYIWSAVLVKANMRSSVKHKILGSTAKQSNGTQCRHAIYSTSSVFLLDRKTVSWWAHLKFQAYPIMFHTAVNIINPYREGAHSTYTTRLQMTATFCGGFAFLSLSHSISLFSLSSPLSFPFPQSQL